MLLTRAYYSAVSVQIERRNLSLTVQNGSLNCDLVPDNQVDFGYIYYPNSTLLSGGNMTWPSLDSRYYVNMAWNYMVMEMIYPPTDGPFARWSSNYRAPLENRTLPCPAAWTSYGNSTNQKVTELDVIMCWPSI